MKVSGQLIRRCKSFQEKQSSPMEWIKHIGSKLHKMDVVSKIDDIGKATPEEMGMIVDITKHKEPNEYTFVYNESLLSEFCQKNGLEYYHEQRDDYYEFRYSSGDNNAMNYLKHTLFTNNIW